MNKPRYKTVKVAEFNMKVSESYYGSFGFDDLSLERQQMIVEKLTAAYLTNKHKGG
jgi:hypothetical protein